MLHNDVGHRGELSGKLNLADLNTKSSHHKSFFHGFSACMLILSSTVLFG